MMKKKDIKRLSGKKKRIALIGSTGGNLFAQGGREATELLYRVGTEAEKWQCDISRILFICAGQSMDNIGSKAPVILYRKGFNADDNLHGRLKEINAATRKLGSILAREISNGEINALISISADPNDVNRKVFEAGKAAGIPIVASGASSVAWMRKIGCNVIYATGTTGTSTELRSINYLAALTRYWGKEIEVAVLKKIGMIPRNISFNFESWSLPYFLLIVLLNGLLHYGLTFLSPIYNGLLQFSALIACLSISVPSMSIPRLGLITVVSTGVMASLFNSGFLGGILIGYLGILIFNSIIYLLAGRRIAGSFQGILIYIATLLPLALLIMITSKPISSISHILAVIPEWLIGRKLIWTGFLIGIAFWPAIQKGYYHNLLLPYIFLEIAEKGASVLGVFDLLCLVVPAIGANLASLIVQYDSKESWRNLMEIIMFGTNVEIVYTIIDKNIPAKLGLFALAGLAGMVAFKFDLRGVGYLPVFVVPFLVEHGILLSFAMIALLIACTTYFYLLLNFVRKAKR